MASTGAAEMLLQNDLSGSVLAQRILTLARDDNRRRAIAAAARAFARPNAAAAIVERAMELVER
jgi:UDP-N-acetylglucosamine:LPS N-acetylglucosamine transferase